MDVICSDDLCRRFLEEHGFDGDDDDELMTATPAAANREGRLLIEHSG